MNQYTVTSRQYLIASAVGVALGYALTDVAWGSQDAMPNTESASGRGYAIYTERERRDQGFGDQRAEMRMTLHGPGGRTATRTLTITEQEGTAGTGDKTLMVFSAPADIADTALLTHEQSGPGDDHQWLYLPAYKRTRRIAGGDRSGRFVGTEFSYEDLASPPRNVAAL